MVRLLPSVTKVDRLFSSTRPRAHLFTQRNETTMRRRGTIRLGLTALAASALLVLPQMAQAAPSEEEIAAAQAAARNARANKKKAKTSGEENSIVDEKPKDE